MKKSILTLFLFILTLSNVSAQFGYGQLKDIERIKEVPLLAVLQSTNEKTIKKITKSKKGDIQKYYSDIENYNNSLKDGLSSSWEFSNEIKFITNEELERYNSKKNKRKYAYFKLDINKGDKFSPYADVGGITTFNYGLYLTGKNKPVYSVMYMSALPNTADFKFISQQLQNYLKMREMIKSGDKSRKDYVEEFNENSPMLKDKILLLDRADLSEKLIEEIHDVYKFDFELTSKAAIDEAILNNDNDKAYLKIVPVGQISNASGPMKLSKLVFVQMVVNAENGELLAYVKPAALGLGNMIGIALKDSKGRMNVRDLKSIVKSIGE